MRGGDGGFVIKGKGLRKISLKPQNPTTLLRFPAKHLVAEARTTQANVNLQWLSQRVRVGFRV